MTKRPTQNKYLPIKDYLEYLTIKEKSWFFSFLTAATNLTKICSEECISMYPVSNNSLLLIYNHWLSPNKIPST